MAPYARSVPGSAFEHTLGQYRAAHSTIDSPVLLPTAASSRPAASRSSGTTWHHRLVPQLGAWYQKLRAWYRNYYQSWVRRTRGQYREVGSMARGSKEAWYVRLVQQVRRVGRMMHGVRTGYGVACA
eukprot:2831661-Rhodomonas_salina.3